ncbi:hypothetical protein C2S51_038111 [Perilla frutescens var. frutescens]|nr:hypothetical protein C2S51_038111 [Perilla frutescens var. frutescens]
MESRNRVLVSRIRHSCSLSSVESANIGLSAICICNNGTTCWKRVLFGYILFSLSTFGLIMVDLVTSGKGGIWNYVGICVLVCVLDLQMPVSKEGLLELDLSFMHPEFNQSFFAGLAASGALTSGLRLLTKAAFDNTVRVLVSNVYRLFFLFISKFYSNSLSLLKYLFGWDLVGRYVPLIECMRLECRKGLVMTFVAGSLLLFHG